MSHTFPATYQIDIKFSITFRLDVNSKVNSPKSKKVCIKNEHFNRNVLGIMVTALRDDGTERET